MRQVEFDPAVFAQRIRDEMEGRPDIGDVKALQQRLARATNARGTSYGQVWAYVNGQAPASGPRPEIIEALADIFRVLPDYLRGFGPRTEADRNASISAERAVQQERRHDPVLQLFRDHLPGAGGVDADGRRYLGPGPAAEAMLWRCFAPLMAARYELTVRERGEDAWHDESEEGERLEAARQLIRAVLAPLRELDALPPVREENRLRSESSGSFAASMWSARLDDYLIPICEALRAIVQRQANSLAESRWRHKQEADDDEQT